MIGYQMRSLLASAAVGLGAFTATIAWASPGAAQALPWDQPLNDIATYLSGPLGHMFAVGSLIGWAILYVGGGSRSEGAKRFARAAVGTTMALAAVRVVNYLLP